MSQISVFEFFNEGTDTVKTKLASHTLAANFEILTYTGTGDFVGTGTPRQCDYRQQRQ
jgi:serralysin